MTGLQEGETRLEELARRRKDLTERLEQAEWRSRSGLAADNADVLRGELARVDSAIREIAGTN